MSAPRQERLRTLEERVRVLSEELARSNQETNALAYELEERVAQRTAELDTARAALEAANQALSHMNRWLEERVKVRDVQLRTAEVRAHDLLERAIHGVVRTDPLQRTVLYANPAAAKMLGYADGDDLVRHVGNLDHDLYADEGAGAAFRRDAEVAGSVRDLVSRFRRRDGTVIWVRENTWSVRSADGSVAFYEAILEDVTEKRSHEERLRLLESAVVNAGDAIVIMGFQPLVSIELPIVFVNAAFERQTGFAAEEVVGKSPMLLRGPGTDVAELDRVTRDMAAGRPTATEIVNYRKDGTPFWVESRIYPVRDPAGEVTHFISIRRDTTERRAAEERLRELSMAVEQSEDLVLISDTSGVVEYVNRSFEFVTGWSRDEVVGRTPRVLKSGRHDAGFYRLLWDTIRSGRVFRGLFVNRTKDGAEFQEEKTIVPLRDAAGTITHFVSTGRDVTQRRALEAQLRHSQRVEALGQLAGSVAHDFNNLLAVISATVDLMRIEVGADSPHAADLDEIGEAAARGADLTRQLLAFGRKSEMAPKPVDLSDFVARKSKLLPRLVGNHIKIVKELGATGGHALVDPGLLDQVIMNLALNARDAMPDGGTLTLRTGHADLGREPGRPGGPRTGSFATLTVADTGQGMDEFTRARIFEPFFTTKKEGRGTGLGLSTVVGIVEQSGGFMEVASQVGAGSTFTVHLPISAPRGAALEGLVAPEGAAVILVVDDDPEARQRIADVIARLGYAAREATSGAEAVEILSRAEPGVDLVLTDYIMPGMSGVELADWVTAHRPGIPVILMSDYAVDPGGTGYGHPASFLAKPFQIEDLDAAVRRTLGT